MINEQSKYNTEDVEYQNIEALLNLYYSTESAALDATEAQYKLLDAQIESYKAITEEIQEFTNFLTDLNELEFSGGFGFERFEESFENSPINNGPKLEFTGATIVCSKNPLPTSLVFSTTPSE